MQNSSIYYKIYICIWDFAKGHRQATIAVLRLSVKERMTNLYGYEVFHERILKSLIDSVRAGKSQHAYIFAGEAGIGKRRAARLFSAALVCENKNLAPCGSCHACIGAKAGTNPDIKYITPGDKKSIGTDIMRELSADAYVRPFESGQKIYIIEDGDIITEQAQNAFLKILEEPPEYAVFIILVSNLSMLLQTIISRCTVIRFTALPRERVKEYIKGRYPTADADFLAAYSGGNPGKADMIMEKEDFFPLRQNALKLILPMVSRHTISAYRIADFLEENKDDAKLILEIWQSILRDMILIKTGAVEYIINSDIEKELREISGHIELKTCVIAENALVRCSEMLRRYVNLRAAALNLSLSIKKAASGE